MITDWSIKRKLTYALALIFVVATATLYVFLDIVFPNPTCFDSRQNGYESGTDCGGTCSLRCKEEVIPLSVLWSRALPTSTSTYDLAALISNKNIDNTPKKVEYTFTAYDANGVEFFAMKGETQVPIDGDFPVILQNILLKERPASVGVQLQSDIPHYKVLEKPADPTIRIAQTRYEAGSIPRVYSTITNTKRLPFSNLPVRVLLYDADGNAYGAGETIVPYLDKEETQELVFTWNRAFKETPTKIRVFPILDPFLGSL
jgi:hypothetical protein